MLHTQLYRSTIYDISTERRWTWDQSGKSGMDYTVRYDIQWIHPSAVNTVEVGKPGRPSVPSVFITTTNPFCVCGKTTNQATALLRPPLFLFLLLAVQSLFGILIRVPKSAVLGHQVPQLPTNKINIGIRKEAPATQPPATMTVENNMMEEHETIQCCTCTPYLVPVRWLPITLPPTTTPIFASK